MYISKKVNWVQEEYNVRSITRKKIFPWQNMCERLNHYIERTRRYIFTITTYVVLHVLLKEIYGLVKYTIPRFMLFLFNRDKCIFLIRFLLYLSCVCHQNFPLGKHCENFLLDSPLRILSEKENRGTFNGSMDNGIYVQRVT